MTDSRPFKSTKRRVIDFIKGCAIVLVVVLAFYGVAYGLNELFFG